MIRMIRALRRVSESNAELPANGTVLAGESGPRREARKPWLEILRSRLPSALQSPASSAQGFRGEAKVPRLFSSNISKVKPRTLAMKQCGHQLNEFVIH